MTNIRLHVHMCSIYATANTAVCTVHQHVLASRPSVILIWHFCVSVTLCVCVLKQMHI